jgi:hypothetical protein
MFPFAFSVHEQPLAKDPRKVSARSNPTTFTSKSGRKLPPPHSRLTYFHCAVDELQHNFSWSVESKPNSLSQLKRAERTCFRAQACVEGYLPYFKITPCNDNNGKTGVHWGCVMLSPMKILEKQSRHTKIQRPLLASTLDDFSTLTPRPSPLCCHFSQELTPFVNLKLSPAEIAALLAVLSLIAL